MSAWVRGLVSERVFKLKLMLTQPPTELELELWLSLAKMFISLAIECT